MQPVRGVHAEAPALDQLTGGRHSKQTALSNPFIALLLYRPAEQLWHSPRSPYMPGMHSPGLVPPQLVGSTLELQVKH